MSSLPLDSLFSKTGGLHNRHSPTPQLVKFSHINSASLSDSEATETLDSQKSKPAASSTPKSSSLVTLPSKDEMSAIQQLAQATKGLVGRVGTPATAAAVAGIVPLPASTAAASLVSVTAPANSAMTTPAGTDSAVPPLVTLSPFGAAATPSAAIETTGDMSLMESNCITTSQGWHEESFFDSECPYLDLPSNLQLSEGEKLTPLEGMMDDVSTVETPQPRGEEKFSKGKKTGLSTPPPCSEGRGKEAHVFLILLANVELPNVKLPNIELLNTELSKVELPNVECY